MADVRLTVSGDTSALERDIRSALASGDSSLRLNTKNFSRPLGTITGQLGEFGKSLEASNARVMAFGASAGAIWAVSAAIKGAAQAAISLEKELAEINVILGTSNKELLGFGNELFNIAKSTGQAFSEVAEGAKELARQGLGMAETLKRTNDALILSRLTGLAAAAAVDTLTAAINGYSQAALTSTQVTSKIIAVDQAFAVSGKDLAEALKRVGSTAAAAGVSFDELLGVVTAAQQITARGGSVIGNSFKTIFTRLQRPKTIEALRELGVATHDASGAMLPMMQIMTNLARTYDTLSQAQQSNIAQLVGGVFQVNVLKASLSDLSRQYSIFSRATEISSSATDEASRRNQELNKTLAAQMNALMQNVQRLGAVIGKLALEPALKRATGLINSFLNKIDISDAESIGSKIGGGLLSGLGNFLSGPGLLILSAGIYKLFSFLTIQAKDALATILAANTAIAQRRHSEQAIIAVLQQDQELVNKITSGTISHAAAVEQVRAAIIAATIAQREMNAVAAAAVASGVGIRPIGGGGRAAGYMPNFISDEYRSEEKFAQAMGASRNVKAHKSQGTIGGRKFVMNNQEVEMPRFGLNGDSAVIPKYYKGFIPNLAIQTVGTFATKYPRVARTLKTNPMVERDDLIDVPAFKKQTLKRRRGESESQYERRAIKLAGATDSRRTMKYGSSAAVDGYMGPNTLLEVKGGSYSNKSVQDKFARGLLENAGIRSSGAKSMYAGRFKERVRRRRDTVRLNRPVLIAATKGGAFATGFIPSFARPQNPLSRALQGGMGTAGPALQALQRDPQGARRLAGVLSGGARGGGAGLQISPEVKAAVLNAFPNIGQRSAARTAQRATAAAERHSGSRLNVLGLNTLGARSVAKPGIREFGFRDPRIRRNFETGFNRRYMMFARGLAGDMMKGIPNQRQMMKAYRGRPPDPAATGQIKGRVFESIVSGMVTGLPRRMKGSEAVDLGRGARIKKEFAGLFTPGAAKIGTGMEIRLGGAGGISSNDARDKLRRFRGRAGGFLPNFAFLKGLDSAVQAEELGMQVAGRTGKARLGTEPRVGPMVYSSFQGTPTQAVNEHLAQGQKFSTLKKSGQALRAAGYIPNFGIGGTSVGGVPVTLGGGGGSIVPTTAATTTTTTTGGGGGSGGGGGVGMSMAMMNLSFGLSFAGGAAAELAKSMGGSDKLGEQINTLSSNLSLAAMSAMMIPGAAGMLVGGLVAGAAIFSFYKKRMATANEDLIAEAELAKSEFQGLNDAVGQYSSTMQQYQDALKATRPDPKAILALERKLSGIITTLPASFQNLIIATNDVTDLQEVLGQAIEAEAKRVAGLQAASSLQDNINESFGKMFGGKKVFKGTEGKLLMKQVLADAQKNMDFSKFSTDVESGSFVLAGKSTNQIVQELKNVYGLSEDLALVFADLASRGEEGEESVQKLIVGLMGLGKQSALTMKQLKALEIKQKRQAHINAARKRGITEARAALKLASQQRTEYVKQVLAVADAMTTSAKKLKFASAETSIEKAKPFLTDEAQAQLDFSMAKAQAQDANITANKEGTREISTAFLDGVDDILGSDAEKHRGLLDALKPFAEAGKLPFLIDNLTRNLVNQGGLTRAQQMQIAGLAQNSSTAQLSQLRVNGIRLSDEVKIAALQYSLAKKQAALERDLRAGGGLDAFLDPDKLGQQLGKLERDTDLFVTASKRGDAQQRGRGLLGMVDFMTESGGMAGLDPDNQQDAQTLNTIANAQGEALRFQFQGIERMFTDAFHQTGDQSLIPLIRIMRENQRRAYEIARTQLLDRIKSRKIPADTLREIEELNELMDREQKNIARDQKQTEINTRLLVNKFPELARAFGAINRFFEQQIALLGTMDGNIGAINTAVGLLPANIARELAPILTNALGPALAPLRLQGAIDRDQAALAAAQRRRAQIIPQAKIDQFQQKQSELFAGLAADIAGGEGDRFLPTHLIPGWERTTFGANDRITRTLDQMAKELAKTAGFGNWAGVGADDKRKFRQRAASKFGMDALADTGTGSRYGVARYTGIGGAAAGITTRIAHKAARSVTAPFMIAMKNALKTQQGKEFLRREGAMGPGGQVDFEAISRFDADKMMAFLNQAPIAADDALRIRGGLGPGGIIDAMMKQQRSGRVMGQIFDDARAITAMERLGQLTPQQVAAMRVLNATIARLADSIKRSQQMQAGYGFMGTLQQAGVDMSGVNVQTAGATANVGAVGSGGPGAWRQLRNQATGAALTFATGPLAGQPFRGIPAGGSAAVTGNQGPPDNKPILQILGPGGPLGTVNMQEGGVVTRRMTATLGERGPEAVIPLDRAVRGVKQTPGIETTKEEEKENPLDVQRNQILQGIGEELAMLRAITQAASAMNTQLLVNVNMQLQGTQSAMVAAIMNMNAVQGNLNAMSATVNNNQAANNQAMHQVAGATSALASGRGASMRNAVAGAARSTHSSFGAFGAAVAGMNNLAIAGPSAGFVQGYQQNPNTPPPRPYGAVTFSNPNPIIR